MYTVLTQNPNKPDCSVQLIQLAAKYSGHQVTLEKSSLENKDSWNIGGKLPSLKTEDGGFWELSAILRFFGRVSAHYPLYGKTATQAGVIDSWIEFAGEIECASTAIYPVTNIQSNTPEVVHEALDKLKVHFDTLNKHFLVNHLLVTNRITIADIILAEHLHPLLTEVLDGAFRKQYPNLIRWFETVVNQPKFLEVFGPTTLFAGKSTFPPVPKKTAPKKKKKEDGEDGGDDDAPLEEAGKKLDLGYLANLPPSTFNLEHWKTKYANTSPTRPEATDYFWQHFDHNGWSCWFYTYNYPEECTLDFKTANLFGGFLQRAESVKQLSKYSMTSQVTLKKGPHFLIHGIWLFRGTVIPPEFLDVDDTNYYTFTKVDVNKPEDREFATDLWAWDSPNNWGGRGEFIAARTWGC